MRTLILFLSLFVSSLAYGQTARLTCYNCQAVPAAYCAPCAAGLKGTEYTSGIVVDKGANQRTFIKKPFSWFVSGNVFTLTDYTGKTASFKASETIYLTVPAVIAQLTECNCASDGGGGVYTGSFNLQGDTGSDSISNQLSILTGTVLKSTVTSNTLTLDWDLTGASPQSIPYYTTGGTGNVSWRTFATGIVDDPTVGGSDATSLQTVLNNINSSAGGLSGDPRNIPYFNASGSPVDGDYFKLDSTSNGVILRVGNPNNYHAIVGTPLSLYNPKIQTYDNSAFGIERTFSSGGSGVVIGTAVNNPTLSFSHINGTYASPANTNAGDIIGITRANARISGNSQQAAASMFFRYTNNADATNTAYEIGFNAASSANAVISDALVIKGNGLYINGGGGDPQWYLPYEYPGTGTKSLQWVSNVPTWVDAPQAISKYNVAITGGNSGANLTIVSYGTGVTASFASNKLTITIPAGVRVLSADWLMVSADIQASADAGGVTNWVQVQFNGTGENTSLADLNIPSIQKVAVPASGALSVTNAATTDFDNNPAISVIGVGSGNITLRFGGMAVGAQGYHAKFTNI